MESFLNKSLELIRELSNHIIASMNEKFIFDKTVLNVTVSIGVSDFAVGANKAMLQSKKNGKNQHKLMD